MEPVAVAAAAAVAGGGRRGSSNSSSKRRPRVAGKRDQNFEYELREELECGLPASKPPKRRCGEGSGKAALPETMQAHRLKRKVGSCRLERLAERGGLLVCLLFLLRLSVVVAKLPGEI